MRACIPRYRENATDSRREISWFCGIYRNVVELGDRLTSRRDSGGWLCSHCVLLSRGLSPHVERTVNCRARQLTIPMLSTAPRKQRQQFRFISALESLLKERGKTQKELAEQAGLSQSRVCRLVGKKSVHTIVASTAVKICLVLSSWPRTRDGKIVAVSLGALYPLKRR